MKYSRTSGGINRQRLRDWVYVVVLALILASSIVIIETTLNKRALTASLSAPTLTHIYSPKNGKVSAMGINQGQYVEINDVLVVISDTNAQHSHTIYSPASGFFMPKMSVGKDVNQGDLLGSVVPSVDARQLYFTVLNGDASQLSIGDKLAISDDKATYPGSLTMIIGDAKRKSGLKLLVLTNMSFSLKSDFVAKKYMIEKWQ
jgi:hypothetical protein